MASTPAPLPSLGLLDGLGTAPAGLSPAPLPHLGLLSGLGSSGATYTLTAEHATINISGPTAFRDFVLVADPAAVNVGGQTASLKAARKLVAEAATVNVSGQAASLTAARKLTADSAVVNIGGQEATLTYSGASAPDYTLTAEAAVVNIGGQAANLTAARKLTAEHAMVHLAGQAVGLGAQLQEETPRRRGASGFALARKRLLKQQLIEWLTKEEPSEEVKKAIQEIKAGVPVEGTEDKPEPKIDPVDLASKLIPRRLIGLEDVLTRSQLKVVRRAAEIAQERDDEDILMLL